MTTRTQDEMHGLGANERALLERIRWAPARRLAVRIVRAKMRVQFAGWLQYLIPIPIIVLLSLLSGISWLLGVAWLTAILLTATALFLLVVVFDIITVKWKIRLPESRPSRNDHPDPFDLFRARRSCRSFQTRLMSDDDRTELLDSVRTQLDLPTMGGAPLRLEYIAAPLTVWPVVNASEFLVAVVPKAYDRSAVIDVGHTLQRVVMDATGMGLGTCWIGPGADYASVSEHLGDRFDMEADQIICVCAVGYRSRYVPLFIRQFNRQMKRRRTLPELFFSDFGLEHPIDVGARPFDSFGRTSEACQWAPSSYNGQTTRAIVATDPNDVSAVHFLATTASRYYAPVALGVWCANWELGCEALGFKGDFVLAPPESDAGRLPRHDVTWVPRVVPGGHST
ncbi:MAG: nitroreductase [Actinomycetia bacterium]|nr:nitroreductase [Actinomycetes bacterium]